MKFVSKRRRKTIISNLKLSKFPEIPRKLVFQDNYLIFLKRYNSWYALVPDLEISYDAGMRVVDPLGGGYVLATQEGTLTAIDTGPKYLDSLNLFLKRYSKSSQDTSLSKIHWSDIRTVIITHFHIDHYLSILNLISLFYKWNESHNKDREIAKLTVLGSKHTIQHLAEIIDSFRAPKTPLQKYADPYILSTTGKKFYLGSKKGDAIREFPLAEINIEATRTDHLEVRDQRDGGVGLLIRAENNRTIGITGDTTYSRDISKQFSDADAIICHLGDFDEVIGRGPKDNHMKLIGAEKLINDSCPRLAILTEFDASTSSERLDIVNRISCPKSTVLVGDIGMTIRFSDLRIKCTRCGSFEDFHKISQAFADEPYTNDRVIENLCEMCSKKYGSKY